MEIKLPSYRSVPLAANSPLDDASELTDGDEGDENEVNTDEITENDVPGSLEVIEAWLPPQTLPRVFEEHKTSERNHLVKGKRSSPLNFRSNYLSGSLSRLQLPLIGACNLFAPGSPHCNPTPLVHGDIKPARLISTTKRPRVHHLETVTCLVTITLRVCLCLDRLTLLFMLFVA
ncbi:hypothetical protein TNCV_2155791 [Trichonephila clavipes]|nr:hypothetical protein TNCV_2155791 [Trichonephila clavipes]